jgi:dihydrofolate reductase
MTITTIPVLLGEGIPLFGAVDGDVPLRHVGTMSYTNGLVQTTYEVV